MPTRDDDDLDILAGLSASRDDTPARKSSSDSQTSQRAAQQAKPKTKSRQQAEKPQPSVANPRTTAQNTSGRGFAWFAGLAILGLVVAGGWLGQQVMQLQQQLADNNNALQLERSRMESISAQVHETGSSFEETGNVLENKFAFFDSEIRKLWDVSNKRNKNAIASNSGKVKSLTADIKKSQQGLKTVVANQADVKKSISKLNKQLAAENTALRATVDDQEEQILLMRSEMELLQKRFSNMPNDIAARVASNEEAVEAIDAGRRQLVTRITQLQKQLDTLLLESSGTP